VVFVFDGGVPDGTDVARMVLRGRGDRLGGVPALCEQGAGVF
jgi:hypothetical protein